MSDWEENQLKLMCMDCHCPLGVHVVEHDPLLVDDHVTAAPALDGLVRLQMLGRVLHGRALSMTMASSRRARALCRRGSGPFCGCGDDDGLLPLLSLLFGPAVVARHVHQLGQNGVRCLHILVCLKFSFFLKNLPRT
jgi:hypothetical protein